MLISGIAFSLVVGWYLRPVMVWHFTVEPTLEAHANATRLHAKTLTKFAAPSIDWPLINVANFSIHAPISSEQGQICETCADHCLLAIEQGTLAIFRAVPEESFEDAIALWAPDAQDISWRRSRPHNWRTIESLMNRVESNTEPPRSFRFRTRESKGVVTIHAIGDRIRLVIYACSLDGAPTRLIGLTGTAIELLYRAVGSLEVHAATSRAARGTAACSIENT
jgi:hypothetical protein